MSEWRKYLNQISRDDGGSCIREHQAVLVKARIDLEIIIPVYNTERYVGECIESALNQNTKYTYRIIIVDDGSTDGCANIIDGYADDSRIEIIHQENRGFSGARNRALDRISAAYVTFLDSDDRLPNGAIEKLLGKAYDGDYDIVGGGYVRFDGEKYGPRAIPQVGQLYGFPWGKVYKSRLWSKIRFPEHYWFEDTVFAMIIHDSAPKKVSIQDVVYDYRLNRKGISAMSVGKPKVIDSFWITSKLLKDRKKLGLPFDDKFQNQLLYQLKVNTIRIYTLGDEKANLANFIGSRECYLLHFDCRCKLSANKEIEDTLFNNNYRQFLLACLFL